MVRGHTLCLQGLEGDRRLVSQRADIDQLVKKVEKAMQAYQICKDRLTKVQETLGQYFEKDEVKGEAGLARGDSVVKRVVQARQSSDGEDGEDIPF